MPGRLLGAAARVRSALTFTASEEHHHGHVRQPTDPRDDARHFGDSGGQPRQRFRAAEQREDWRNAVAYVRGFDEVDAARVALWGFSFSGGHVTRLLIDGLDAAAAIVLCPFVDGIPP